MWTKKCGTILKIKAVDYARQYQTDLYVGLEPFRLKEGSFVWREHMSK